MVVPGLTGYALGQASLLSFALCTCWCFCQEHPSAMATGLAPHLLQAFAQMSPFQWGLVKIPTCTGSPLHPLPRFLFFTAYSTQSYPGSPLTNPSASQGQRFLSCSCHIPPPDTQWTVYNCWISEQRDTCHSHLGMWITKTLNKCNKEKEKARGKMEWNGLHDHLVKKPRHREMKVLAPVHTAGKEQSWHSTR